MATDPVLSISRLRVALRSLADRAFAVEDVSLAVAPGETLCVVGESGSGKSMLALAVMGLLPVGITATGEIRLDGRELLGLPEAALCDIRGREVAMVFQEPMTSLNPVMRVADQVAESFRAHGRFEPGERRRRALALLDEVGLPDPPEIGDAYPHEISGGQRQRVMIAMALALEPKLLIADEPTTALDVTTQAQIMELLLELQEKLGMALVMISHDLGLAASFADEVIVMYAGRAVEQAPTRELFRNVRMPYTKALLEAIPRLERPPHTMLPVVPGRPPDLTSLGAGCPFEPRCPNAQQDCREVAPPLTEHEPSHRYACYHPVRAADFVRGRRPVAERQDARMEVPE